MSELISHGYHGITRTAKCPFCGAIFKYDNRDIYPYVKELVDRDEHRKKLICPDCYNSMRLYEDGHCGKNLDGLY